MRRISENDQIIGRSVGDLDHSDLIQIKTYSLTLTHSKSTTKLSEPL